MNIFEILLNPEMLLNYLIFMGTMIVFFIVFFVVATFVFYLPGLLAEGIIRYFLFSVILYKLAKLKDFRYPWFSFIPFLRIYLQLIIPEGNTKFIIQFKDRKSMALTLTIIEAILDMLPFKGILGIIIGIAVTVLYIRRIYDFLEVFDKDNAVIATVFSFLFGAFAPVYTLFLWAEYPILDKKDKVNE